MVPTLPLNTVKGRDGMPVGSQAPIRASLSQCELVVGSEHCKFLARSLGLPWLPFGALESLAPIKVADIDDALPALHLYDCATPPVEITGSILRARLQLAQELWSLRPEDRVYLHADVEAWIDGAIAAESVGAHIVDADDTPSVVFSSSILGLPPRLFTNDDCRLCILDSSEETAAERTIRRFHNIELGTYATKNLTNIHVSQGGPDGKFSGAQVAQSYFNAPVRTASRLINGFALTTDDDGSFIDPEQALEAPALRFGRQKGKKDQMMADWSLPKFKMRTVHWWKAKKGYYFPIRKHTNVLRRVYRPMYKRNRR